LRGQGIFEGGLVGDIGERLFRGVVGALIVPVVLVEDGDLGRRVIMGLAGGLAGHLHPRFSIRI
jgi:hypothetical protein